MGSLKLGICGLSALTTLLVAAGAGGLATASAATAAVTCPIVNPTTHAVSPPPSPGVDWEGCNLAGADLAGADLSHARLAGADLSGADLNSAELNSAAAVSSNLAGAVLTGASLSGADLSESNLTGADLTDISALSVNLSSATLTGVTLTGADLTLALLSGVISGHVTGTPKTWPMGWSLVDGYLIGPGSDLAGVDLAGADLSHSDLSAADLAGANLTGANLSSSDLSVADLSGTSLAAADLTGVEGGQISGTPASLPENWALADGYLIGPGVFLYQASLPGADLSGLDLAGADVSAANMAGANLDGANLDGATFEDSTLIGATVTGAQLDNITWSDTICPDGSNSDQHLDGCFSPLDKTPPVVKVTGIRSGHVYTAGRPPRPGCTTTDQYSPVTVPAKLTVTTNGSHGTGTFTATCSGAKDLAGNTAAPVSASFKVVYGLPGFLTPRPRATLSRSARTITVTFRLTDAAGTAIPRSIAAALGRSHTVRVTLRGPGISPVTATCGWNAGHRYFRCALRTPAKVRAHTRYTITADENLKTGFVAAPATSRGHNPEVVYFS